MVSGAQSVFQYNFHREIILLGKGPLNNFGHKAGLMLELLEEMGMSVFLHFSTALFDVAIRMHMGFSM